jgi:hypothetical protein
MGSSTARLSVRRLSAIAREAIRGEHHQIVAAVPSREGSDYAEIIVGSTDHKSAPMTIGVRRSESEDHLRREIARRVRDRDESRFCDAAD